MFHRLISRGFTKFSLLPTFEELNALTLEVRQHRCAQSLGGIYSEMRHIVNSGEPRIIIYKNSSHGFMEMHFHKPQFYENTKFYAGVLQCCNFEVKKLTATKHKFSGLDTDEFERERMTAYEIVPPVNDDLYEPLKRNKKREQDRIYKKLLLEYYDNIRNGGSNYVYISMKDYDEEVIEMMKKEGFKFSDTRSMPASPIKLGLLDAYFPYPDSMEIKCMHI